MKHSILPAFSVQSEKGSQADQTGGNDRNKAAAGHI